MQAVILAAGESSRFVPYADGHKTVITLLGKPIIQHTIESVKKVGIENIIIIVSPDSKVQTILGDGKNFGVTISYILQPQPLGAGNALLLAEKVLEDDFFLLNASHIDFSEFAQDMLAKNTSDVSTVLLTKKTDSSNAYGVAATKEERVIEVVEKPKNQKEALSRIIGIYLFKKSFLATLKNTPTEHYQLEAALGVEAKKGLVTFTQTEKSIVTLKYAWDLFGMKDYLLSTITSYTADSAKISSTALIEGNVVIEDNATIMENAIIKGPAYIGKGALVGTQAFIRNGTILEEKAVAGSKIEIKNTILMKGATTHSGLIEDSIIGENCKIAAGVTTGNVRLDREEISVEVKGEKITSHRKFLGVLMGHRVNFGIKVSTMPGIIIGGDSIVGPETIVMKNIPPHSKYYTKFQEIIEKITEHE